MEEIISQGVSNTFMEADSDVLWSKMPLKTLRVVI